MLAACDLIKRHHDTIRLGQLRFVAAKLSNGSLFLVRRKHLQTHTTHNTTEHNRAEHTLNHAVYLVAAAAAAAAACPACPTACLPVCLADRLPKYVRACMRVLL
jgi:hypothetical protein